MVLISVFFMTAFAPVCFNRDWRDVVGEFSGAGADEGPSLCWKLIDSPESRIHGSLAELDGEVLAGNGIETSCRHPKRTTMPPVLIMKEDVELTCT